MRDYDQYLTELRRRGYVTRRSLGTGHLKIFDPHGCLVGVHSGNGGSDRRGLLNLKADIRRHQCLAGEKQGEHVQPEARSDERRPDRAGSDYPCHDRGHSEQQERNQDQEPVYAADGEAAR
jgi:hypothetical protein